MNDDNTLKIAEYTGTRTPAPQKPVVEDGGYVIGDRTQDEYEKQLAALPKESVNEALRKTRRAMVLDLANILYLNESGSILKTRAFDKNDVSCQRYIRMAEAAFEWMIKR